MFLPDNLPTDDEAGLEILAFYGAFFLLFQADIANIIGDLFDTVYGEQCTLSILFDVVVYLGDDGLAGRQIAGSQDDELSIAIDSKSKHLTVGGYLVNTGIGEGI